MREERYERHKNDSYQMRYHKEPMPMFYITLLSSSSTSGNPGLELKDSKRSKDSKSKNNDDSGAMFQCQELDGGNAIERKSRAKLFLVSNKFYLFNWIRIHRNITKLFLYDF